MANHLRAVPPLPVTGSVPIASRREPLWRHLVGDLLRERRHDRGETLGDVARRAGVAPQYLSEIERGRKEPSSEVVQAVASALDLTLRDLLDDAGRRLAASEESISQQASVRAPTLLAA
jgi:transcriptional regulator with XRE-family HTH domain